MALSTRSLRLPASMLAAALALTACGSGGEDSSAAAGNDLPTVRFSGLPDPAPLPVLVMQELGIDEEHGFNAEFIEVDPDASTSTFLIGESDIGVDQDATSSAIANNEGHDVVSFYPAMSNTAAIVVAEDSPYQTPADLVGKRVGHFGDDSGTTQALAVSLQEAHGINPLEDYEMVQSSPAALPELLASGEVDAIFDFEPYGLRAIEQTPGRYLFQVTDYWQEAANWSPPLAMLTARMEWLEENAELAREVQAAWKEAVQAVVDSDYQLFLEEPYASFLDVGSEEELQALADYCAELPCYASDWTQQDVDQQMTYLELLVEQGGLEQLPEVAPVAVLDDLVKG
ncbi:ABC transporter substrate-binding protein [Geodermatophilus sabuli]|uniref:NitT/TauT family transport system substrate-binding protein n=1 Tax=Geodermatophilus sabuli TaxID=1564158 RepID=A0A285EAZ3_9ACTN|nr:ABC transporter substrate-binding protein [Geodermatophilus sabuli]MBB3085290.1 NitT/TauT family transport system substrate-binding protein [Geodermatophilus sabuli]SNX96282.1 NitT/TauT family transport system substrate-binding protein [Geodermatophilus sabuli]